MVHIFEFVRFLFLKHFSDHSILLLLSSYHPIDLTLVKTFKRCE